MVVLQLITHRSSLITDHGNDNVVVCSAFDDLMIDDAFIGTYNRDSKRTRTTLIFIFVDPLSRQSDHHIYSIYGIFSIKHYPTNSIERNLYI